MIYVFDGSWDGLMCLVRRLAEDGGFPEDILRRDDGVLFETARVASDPRLASATEAALRKRVSGRMLSEAWFASLSDVKGIDTAIVRSLAKIWAGRSEEDLADEDMHAVHRAARRTGAEYDKHLGLVRFRDVGGLFYAELEPDCDLLALLAAHFSARLADQAWILRDLRREKAAVYDTRSWFVTDRLPRVPPETKEELAWQELWRGFYRSVAARERLNPTVQRGHMPKKYWKHLTEKPGETRSP